MGWRMPSETAPHARTWMAFPVEGPTLGDTDAEREEGYAAWTEVAAAIARVIVHVRQGHSGVGLLDVGGRREVAAGGDQKKPCAHGPTLHWAIVAP